MGTVSAVTCAAATLIDTLTWMCLRRTGVALRNVFVGKSSGPPTEFSVPRGGADGNYARRRLEAEREVHAFPRHEPGFSAPVVSSAIGSGAASGTMAATCSRIWSTPFLRSVAIMSSAMACAANSEARATWTCTADCGYSLASSHRSASSARSLLAVVSLPPAAVSRRFQSSSSMRMCLLIVAGMFGVPSSEPTRASFSAKPRVFTTPKEVHRARSGLAVRELSI